MERLLQFGACPTWNVPFSSKDTPHGTTPSVRRIPHMERPLQFGGDPHMERPLQFEGYPTWNAPFTPAFRQVRIIWITLYWTWWLVILTASLNLSCIFIIGKRLLRYFIVIFARTGLNLLFVVVVVVFTWCLHSDKTKCLEKFPSSVRRSSVCFWRCVEHNSPSAEVAHDFPSAHRVFLGIRRA